MLQGLLFLGSVLLGCPGVSQTKEPAKPAQPEPSYVKAEVRGTLSVTGAPGKIDQLEAIRSAPQNLNYNQMATLVSTGVTVATIQLGSLELYLGDDKHLIEKAKQLNGKNVVVSGDLRQMWYCYYNCYPQQVPFGTEPGWGPGWQPPGGPNPYPQPYQYQQPGWGPQVYPAMGSSTVKTFIFVTSIKAAE
jgi:hypothetical protein